MANYEVLKSLLKLLFDNNNDLVKRSILELIVVRKLRERHTETIGE